MNKLDLDNILLNISNVFVKDKEGNSIYPGDILIKNNERYESFEYNMSILLNRRSNKNLKSSFLLDKYTKLIYFLTDLKSPATFFNFHNDIVVAEYFNLKEFIKTPILFFIGIEQSFHFDMQLQDMTNYKIIKEKDIDIQRIGLLTIFEEFGNKIKTECDKLNSIFGKNYEILKIVEMENYKILCFKYKIKNSVYYKKVKKYQKGIFQRLNWHKNSNKILFPNLYYYLDGNNIFKKITEYKDWNKNKSLDYWSLIYKVENEMKKDHSYLEIFCSKYDDLKNKIYFYKGK